MRIEPYVLFDGNCEEAFKFYQSALGGELQINRFEGSPMENQVPPDAKQKVMHVALSLKGVTLMGADFVGETKIKLGNNIALSLATSDEREADQAFAKLSAGGTVKMPMERQFWGAKFGMLTDKFGVDWMVSYHEG
jgi:PhnB protein